MMTKFLFSLVLFMFGVNAAFCLMGYSKNIIAALACFISAVALYRMIKKEQV
jgi:multisubunit Na+/H+ antiporter MnhC subunit